MGEETRPRSSRTGAERGLDGRTQTQATSDGVCACARGEREGEAQSAGASFVFSPLWPSEN
jgi:hypothetical protein